MIVDALHISYMPFIYKSYIDLYDKIEIKVNFSHKFSKKCCCCFFLIERPSNNAHSCGLIENNHSEAHLYRKRNDSRVRDYFSKFL